MTDAIDDTQPHPLTAEPGPAGPPTGTPLASGSTPASGTPPPPGPAPSATPPEPGLRVDPDRPSDPSWREPAWMPPRDRHDRRDRRSGTFAIVAGLILIAIGAWYFLETTLGLDLPRIRWGSLWPVILILIGGLILVRSVQRRS